MKNINPKHTRSLAIALSTRGFGFAVLEGAETLVDWGVKTVKGDKNSQCLAKVECLIVHYQPALIILQDLSAKDSRRSARIRTLSLAIIEMVVARRLKVALVSGTQINQMFFGKIQGTKYARAQIIAKRFPEELGFRLPPKRRAWMSEDYRMAIFDAVALGLVARSRKPGKKSHTNRAH